MRASILSSARAIAQQRGSRAVTLDEIAAVAAIKLDHLRAYFTSVDAVLLAADVTAAELSTQD